TTTTTTPSTTTTTQNQTANKRFGDANMDNMVNMSDAVLVMQSIANPNKYVLSGQGKINADVTGDNDGVTAKDAQYIQMSCLGLVKLP
ncbi:MAG: dockerin type I repeat-containing protein, partial [Ruminococcus sp.]|nr:dockerin type I repeat-containing protein [Ruminococcus sp.]